MSGKKTSRWTGSEWRTATDVDEQERREAVAKLMDWSRQDDTVRRMIHVVCLAHKQPAVGHLARYVPEIFDELFEEAEAMMGNDV